MEGECTLTDKELDSFIAEKVMGWKEVGLSRSAMNSIAHLYDTKSLWTDDEFQTDLEYYQSRILWKRTDGHKVIIGFTKDLNSCREAEIKLTCDKFDYEGALMDLLFGKDQPCDIYQLITATARQRCEAMWSVLNDS